MYKTNKEYKLGDVVQFIEGHKWCGCLGFINEIKPNRLMVGVDIPEQGVAYIYCKSTDIEYIGEPVMMPVIERDE